MCWYSCSDLLGLAATVIGKGRGGRALWRATARRRRGAIWGLVRWGWRKQLRRRAWERGRRRRGRGGRCGSRGSASRRWATSTCSMTATSGASTARRSSRTRTTHGTYSLPRFYFDAYIRTRREFASTSYIRIYTRDFMRQLLLPSWKN